MPSWLHAASTNEQRRALIHWLEADEVAEDRAEVLVIDQDNQSRTLLCSVEHNPPDEERRITRIALGGLK